jgi:hypothetical protein
MIVVGIVLAGWTTACSDGDDNTPGPALMELGAVMVDSAETQVVLLAEDSVQMGFTSLYVMLKDTNGRPVSNAEVTLSPMMHMTDMGMMHACPVEQPLVDVHGYFRGAVVFIMASYDSGHWELGVDFHNHENDRHGTAMFEVPVRTSSKCKTVAGTAGNYVITLVEPLRPAVGMNDVNIAVYQRQSMMSFPAVSGFTFHMTPWMPSMGHGSPNNVDPVHSEEGHYVGAANFTMTGDWRLDLVLTGTDSLTTYFDLMVE